jgi:hypothetical protein
MATLVIHSATLSRVAHALAYVVGDVDGAMDFIERARKLNPNLPSTWYVSGWLKLWLGQPAMDHLTTALRLAPFHPLSFKTHGAITYAHLIAGRYDQASFSAANALRGRPSSSLHCGVRRRATRLPVDSTTPRLW